MPKMGKPPQPKVPGIVHKAIVRAIADARKRGLQMTQLGDPVSRKDPYDLCGRMWVHRALNWVDRKNKPVYMTSNHARCLVWRANALVGLPNALALNLMIGQYEPNPVPAWFLIYPKTESTIADELLAIIRKTLPRTIGRGGKKERDLLLALRSYLKGNTVDDAYVARFAQLLTAPEGSSGSRIAALIRG